MLWDQYDLGRRPRSSELTSGLRPGVLLLRKSQSTLSMLMKGLHTYHTSAMDTCIGSNLLSNSSSSSEIYIY